MPWGELVSFETGEALRADDGSVSWRAGCSLGLEPCLGPVIRETETWIMGWLGGTCDAVAVISEGGEGPEP